METTSKEGNWHSHAVQAEQPLESDPVTNFYASVENFKPWKLVVGSCILLLHFLGEQGLKLLMCFGNQHIQEHICTPAILFLTKPVLFSNTSS